MQQVRRLHASAAPLIEAWVSQGAVRSSPLTLPRPMAFSIGLVLPVLGALSACAPPFDVARKDLGPFRIAAMGVHDGQAHAAVWSGQGMAHAEAPVLEWSVDGQVIGQGNGLILAEDVQDGAVLELVATSAIGEQAQGQLSVIRGAQDLVAQRAAVAVGEDLSLAVRRELPELDAQHGAQGQGVRVSLAGARGTLRWMSALGVGTVLELSDTQADVLADEVVFENEEGAWVVAEREPGEPGIYHQLVLDLDADSGNRWVWVDVAIGVDDPLIQHYGRLIPGEVTLGAGLMQSTLEVVDGELVLGSLLAVEDLSTQSPLDCAPIDQAFRLDWVSEGRCGLGELHGATLVLEIQ
ncbi:MAG: hypothetical protein ACI9VR_001224 [Cognaticolwellia sp.]|jgi:hypothetical protein